MNARMEDYYAEHLAAEKLHRCYEIAPPRVQQYLRAELEFALKFIRSGDAVLDLGCGYGRTLPDLAARAGSVTAVDNAPASVALARETTAGLASVEIVEMDAAKLRFLDNAFDVVLCLQNGISAFHRDPTTIMREALRVCRPGGLANGFIACKDGFTATTFTPDQFRSLAADLPAALTLTEVDGSSLFCILRRSGPE